MIFFLKLCGFYCSTSSLPKEGSTSMFHLKLIYSLRCKFWMTLLLFYVLVSGQEQAAQTDPKYIRSDYLSAASATTLAATCSALLLGLQPTNPLTPRKHKWIDLFLRGPDNPAFQVCSHLSFITGILSLISSAVTREASRALDPSPVFINMSDKPLTSDRGVFGHSGGSRMGRPDPQRKVR